MTIDILPTRGREVLAEELSSLPFLFALSRGSAAWDGTWGGVNEPAPAMDASSVLDVVGFARPTVTSFVTPVPGGAIVADSGATYAISAEITRFLRVRLSVPANTFAGNTIREIGLFVRPTIAAGVPAGQTIIAPEDVSDPGDLLLLSWFRPQFLSAGTSLARNAIVRL